MRQQELFPEQGMTVGQVANGQAEASEEAKRQGMAKAAQNKQSLLAFARGLAVDIAMSRDDRCCTADDVQEALVRHGISDRALGNAAGSLFVGGDWKFTGRWVKSCRVHAHANDIRVWRYVGGHGVKATAVAKEQSNG